jgi:4-methyl-5(b-hydroxyethyl)-thiazole monophosphate biosynthesis
VVVDGKLVTSRGPGTALPFALRLAELLTDPETAATLGRQMLVSS